MIRLRVLGGKLAAVCGAVALLVPSLPAQALTSDGQSRINTVAEDKSTPCQIGTTAMVAQAPNVISLLGIKKAWQLSRGSKVKVAIVDSGVVASNVHLTENVLPGIDLVDSGDGRTDAAGHGTAIAGQIAAHEVEGSGLVGLAPEAEILPVRVYVSEQHDATSAGKGPDGARTAKGIVWAADQGAKVIVVAQSSPTDLPELKAAVEHAAASGALVVASAGNVPQDQQNRTEDPKAPRYPAAYPQALSVTAVDANGAPSDSVLHGEHVEVAAPGSQVLSTFFGDGDCMFAGNQPTTSYATGYVAGIAALMVAKYPDETPADWKHRILATALRPSRSHRDKLIGWGIVAPYDALSFVNDGSLEGPENPRFPAPTKQETPLMTPPEPKPDPRPARTAALGVMAGISCLAALAILIASRLRGPSQKKSRK